MFNRNTEIQVFFTDSEKDKNFFGSLLADSMSSVLYTHQQLGKTFSTKDLTFRSKITFLLSEMLDFLLTFFHLSFLSIDFLVIG